VSTGAWSCLVVYSQYTAMHSAIRTI